MKLIWSTAALAVFLFLHAPGCTHGSLTEAEEASIITNVAVVFSRAARMRSRRIQAKWEQHPELCASYRNQGRSALSACWASAGEMTGVANHMGELCSRHDQVVNVTYDERRESCLLDDGCQWDAPPGKRKKHRWYVSIGRLVCRFGDNNNRSSHTMPRLSHYAHAATPIRAFGSTTENVRQCQQQLNNFLGTGKLTWFLSNPQAPFRQPMVSLDCK